MAGSSSRIARVLSDRVAKATFAEKGGSVGFERVGNLKSSQFHKVPYSYY